MASRHPEGCSCGSPDCPQWQQDQLGFVLAEKEPSLQQAIETIAFTVRRCAQLLAVQPSALAQMLAERSDKENGPDCSQADWLRLFAKGFRKAGA